MPTEQITVQTMIAMHVQIVISFVSIVWFSKQFHERLLSTQSSASTPVFSFIISFIYLSNKTFHKYCSMLLYLLMPMSSGCHGTAAKRVFISSIRCSFCHFTFVSIQQHSQEPKMCLGEMSTVFQIKGRTTLYTHTRTLPSLSFICTILARCATVAWFYAMLSHLFGNNSVNSQRLTFHYSKLALLFFASTFRNPFFVFFGFALSLFHWHFLCFNVTLYCMHSILWLSMLVVRTDYSHCVPPVNSCSNPIKQVTAIAIVFSSTNLFCFVLLCFVSQRHTCNADSQTLSLGV